MEHVLIRNIDDWDPSVMYSRYRENFMVAGDREFIYEENIAHE